MYAPLKKSFQLATVLRQYADFKEVDGGRSRSPARLAVVAANLLCGTALEGLDHSNYYHRWYALSPYFDGGCSFTKRQQLAGIRMASILSSRTHLFIGTSTIMFRERI